MQGTHRTEHIGIDLISAIPDIYRDYILHFDRVKGFYARDYRDPTHIAGAARSSKSGFADRKNLKDVLVRQATEYAADEAVTSNIDHLYRGCSAVVTGQQVGLLGGPLYTVYKAATAIQLAEELSSAGTEKYVPVFWMEAEDHDNIEVGRVYLLDALHRLSVLKTYSEPARRPAGLYEVGEEITGLVGKVEECLKVARHVDSTVKELRECYRPGRRISLAFAILLSRLFHGKGLVIVDPADPALKREASSVYLEAVRNSRKVSEAISDSSSRLQEKGYHPQIEVQRDRAPFFIITEGERLPVSVEGDGFTIASGSQMTRGELESMAEREPERYSPNVALRPIVQDYLFSTAVYVGGPGEIAYMAQVAPLYGIFGLDMPAVFPRAHFTFVEPAVARALEKLGCGITDLSGPEEIIRDRLVRRAGGLSGLEVLRRARSQLENVADEMADELLGVEPGMAGPLGTYRKKTSYQFKRLEQKLRTMSMKRHDTLIRQMETVRNHLFPLDRSQERIVNTCYYMALLGDGFVPAVLSNLRPFEFRHIAIWI